MSSPSSVVWLIQGGGEREKSQCSPPPHPLLSNTAQRKQRDCASAGEHWSAAGMVAGITVAIAVVMRRENI